ncbi:hypothetical protein Kpol_1023p44 [Vanderwaltozyma polyspora DSM 70294]|uniref:Protein CFT1 n=1 Tax=Vanderwaltozyma polyspora (strain ATCC 22028 / DSM 70294 / BCRC 21397 / CBS 2163 / NBRC 10782 / NRRL Y-8283 / UCD 57-17) TaxID=436907 RepID=A7TFR7_VANPO|nr:uncharacterized protein Kpol_1023p44 [Vanderwaltozyma polyspora DSM 70294]EDO18875.1 hypothetical protein Kpol_1023p44 [Vanderwaltozyma polyspora DSM 70294]
MNVYDDVLDATVVSHSVVGNFTTKLHKELITVRTNLLSIYRFDDKGKLFLTNEFKLIGKVTDISLIPQKNSDLDVLLISTRTAKLSIVKFNTNSNSLETITLHYYQDKFKDISLLELAETSQLRIDNSKNVVLLFNVDCIAILPFVKAEEDEEEEEDDDNNDNDDEGNNDQNNKKNNSGKHSKSLTEPSIIITGKQLNSNIKNIIDIQFLQNFSKPTIGVLYQPNLAWIGNSSLTALPTDFIIITLDLIPVAEETQWSTTVIGTVNELPFDVHSFISLCNGNILVGTNEIIYIDNTAVLQTSIVLNQFIDKNFKKGKIIDRSNLGIIFNKPIKHYISPPDKIGESELLLLMDQNSIFYYIQLDLEGRLLTNFDITELPIVNDLLKENSNPTCISCISEHNANNMTDLFIGYQSGDALVLRLNNIKSAITSKEQHMETVDSLYEFDEDEDNLYGDESSIDAKSGKKEILVESIQPFNIELLSQFKNIGPLTSLAVGKASSIETNVKGLANPNQGEYSLVGTSGNGTGSHLTIVQQSMQPQIELALKFISVTQIWNLKIKSQDKYLITTDSKNSKSDIYSIEKNFKLFREGRFRRDATTVYISMFGENKRIVQVTTNHLYLYDLNFHRLTTMNFEFEVVNVSVMDPYILITLSRGDIKIYELENKRKKKLFRVELPDVLPEMVLTSGVILKSNMCNEFLTGMKKSDKEELLFTFVTADNQIIFFPRNHHDRIFQLNGIDQLDELLYISIYQLPDEVIPDPQIKQVMINKLGKESKEEYLTILTFGGEIYQYKKSPQRHSRFHRNLYRNNLSITGAPENAYAKGVSSIERIMHYIPEYNGYSVIFVPGNVPYIIMKEDNSVPRVFKFANIPIVSMSPWGHNSVMCVDDIKNARVYTLDRKDIYYGNQLPLKKIRLSDTIEDYKSLTKVVYNEKSQLFVVAYAKEIDYEALAEDGETLIGYDPNAKHAKGFQAGILLVNPKTWNVIDKIEFERNSLINDMRSMTIQVNSKTKKKRELLVVGVASIGTEDLPSAGSFHVIDINEVVPEPGKPDTNYKFKEIFQETVRGNVNSVCEISGRFMINQSQKLLVRDIQEDESVVPVAFLDVPVYVTDTKSFSNLMIVGDSMQGFQFVGFDAEPYRMIPLGRSVSKFKTVALEFLVNNGDIFFIVSDRNDILHVLKYAPDEPNSLSGQRLAHYSSFNIHSTNTSMILLPSNNEFQSSPNGQATFQSVGSCVDGSIFKVIPLDEDSFRRLYVIQQQVIDTEIQAGGLNPRMERLSNEYYQLVHLMRPMLDFNIIRRFSNLSITKRTKIAQKAGRRAHFDVWRDMINIEFSLRSLCGNK